MATSGTEPAVTAGSARRPTGKRPAGRRWSSRTSSEGPRPVYKNRYLPYLLVAPQLIITGVFFLWPTGLSIYESVISSGAFGLTSRYVGLGNFISIFENEDEVHSLIVTLVLAVLITVISMAIGLFLAVETDQVGPTKRIYRTLFVWTYAVPGAIAGALWLFLFEPGVGPGAKAFTALGVDWNIALSGTQAFGLIVVLIVWQQSAYNFLFFTAGLQIIPNDVIEAAAVDGAGKVARFWRIVFPLLSPTTFFLVVMNVLFAIINSFAIIDVVTAGGPGNSTTTLVYQLYRDGFINSETGLAGAETIVLLIIVAIITILQFRFLNRKVHYQ